MHAEPTSTDDDRGPAAFRAFYEEHHAFVCRAIGRFGVAPAEQGDAVQDTFVTAYRKLGRTRVGSTRAWLYGIARRIASNYRRGAQRAARKHEAARDGFPSVSPQTLDALHTLDRFLDALEPTDRELFVLSEILGLTGPEIAEAIAMRQGMVYARLRLLRVRAVESAPDGLFAALCRIRADEPRAHPRSWLALAAALRPELPAVLGGLGWARIALAIVPLSLGTVAIAAAVPDDARTPVATFEPAVRVATTMVPTLPAAVPELAPRAPAPLPVHASAPPARALPRAPSPARDDGNALLTAAIAALEHGEADRALALTDTHARRFADSPLADSRWALRIEALCGAGKDAQARGEARAFLAAHPDAPAAASVRAGCPTPRKNAALADTARSR